MALSDDRPTLPGACCVVDDGWCVETKRGIRGVVPPGGLVLLQGGRRRHERRGDEVEPSPHGHPRAEPQQQGGWMSTTCTSCQGKICGVWRCTAAVCSRSPHPRSPLLLDIDIVKRRQRQESQRMAPFDWYAALTLYTAPFLGSWTHAHNCVTLTPFNLNAGSLFFVSGALCGTQSPPPTHPKNGINKLLPTQSPFFPSA